MVRNFLRSGLLCGSGLRVALKGMIAIGAGTFDPPAFWFAISGEIFTRSKAPFITIDCADRFETSPAYKPVKEDDNRFNGDK